MMTTQARYRPPGGIHPVYHKERTRHVPVRDLPVAGTLSVSMSQHLGAPARPVVRKGDTVRRGQLIGEPTAFVSAAVHAPVAGRVLRIAPAPALSGVAAPSVEIQPDPQGACAPFQGLGDAWASADPQTLVRRIAAAGIVGMGGAGFPTHVKLSPPAEKPIDTLILNGAECEPCLTADFRLMVEHAEQVWEGCRILRHVLGAARVRVAIEDNKPEAIAAMQEAMAHTPGDIALVVLDSVYPMGAEKQQIFAVTGREVPSGGLPMDVGTLVENVGTAFAVREAVVNGVPLMERITTVTGSPVESPANLRASIGTPLAALLESCGASRDFAKLICGGPLMGLAQAEPGGALAKTTSGLLLLSASETPLFTSMPCIGCGRCVSVCPMRLVPADLSQFLESEDYAAAESYNVQDCIECGCCAYECPAHRPLVQHMRRGKAWAAAKRRERAASA